MDVIKSCQVSDTVWKTSQTLLGRGLCIFNMKEKIAVQNVLQSVGSTKHLFLFLIQSIQLADTMHGAAALFVSDLQSEGRGLGAPVVTPERCETVTALPLISKHATLVDLLCHVFLYMHTPWENLFSHP